MYKLGVLISVYRSEDPELFRRAIGSILQQRTSMDSVIRIYLGVDGPIPEPLDLAIRETEPHLYKVLRFRDNRGLAPVLNDLIAAREDEDFYFRMDTDDISLAGRFEKQLRYMLTHPEIDILGTDMIESEADTGRTRIVHYADNPEQARRKISVRVPVAHPTVCFRARVFEQIAGYPLKHLNEDLAMWFVCLKAGLKFDNVPEPLYEFRISSNFWKRRGLRKAWLEFTTFCSGLWSLEGVSWRYVFPILRLGARLVPVAVQRMLYQGEWRGQHAIVPLAPDSAPTEGSTSFDLSRLSEQTGYRQAAPQDAVAKEKEPAKTE